MPCPLKVGVLLLDTEHQMNGGSARWADLPNMARTVEAVGFDSVWVTDRLIYWAEKPLASRVKVVGNLRNLERMLVATDRYCGNRHRHGSRGYG